MSKRYVCRRPLAWTTIESVEDGPAGAGGLVVQGWMKAGQLVHADPSRAPIDVEFGRGKWHPLRGPAARVGRHSVLISAGTYHLTKRETTVVHVRQSFPGPPRDTGAAALSALT